MWAAPSHGLKAGKELSTSIHPNASWLQMHCGQLLQALATTSSPLWWAKPSMLSPNKPLPSVVSVKYHQSNDKSSKTVWFLGTHVHTSTNGAWVLKMFRPHILPSLILIDTMLSGCHMSRKDKKKLFKVTVLKLRRNSVFPSFSKV